jgi:hypothetical protein
MPPTSQLVQSVDNFPISSQASTRIEACALQSILKDAQRLPHSLNLHQSASGDQPSPLPSCPPWFRQCVPMLSGTAPPSLPHCSCSSTRSGRAADFDHRNTGPDSGGRRAKAEAARTRAQFNSADKPVDDDEALLWSLCDDLAAAGGEVSASAAVASRSAFRIYTF